MQGRAEKLQKHPRKQIKYWNISEQNNWIIREHNLFVFKILSGSLILKEWNDIEKEGEGDEEKREKEQWRKGGKKKQEDKG